MSDGKLYLVRHGETASNAAGLWQGRHGDDPLNERGREQSLAVAEALADSGATALYASDLRRAAETAGFIGARLGLPVQSHAGLREYGFGDMEGATTAEALARWKTLLRQWRTDPSAKPPGGESAVEFTMRVGAALQEIVDRHQDETVIVVAHGGSLSVGLAVLVGEPGNWQDYQMTNCGISIVDMGPDRKILTFDQTSHLAGIGVTAWAGVDVRPDEPPESLELGPESTE
ncbi:MAG: alpha-ribazole phosphatase [Anaerolineae bacterium]|nr:alpha-ribazole phosphatase [Anaerolineae bacterium]